MSSDENMKRMGRTADVVGWQASVHCTQLTMPNWLVVIIIGDSLRLAFAFGERPR